MLCVFIVTEFVMSYLRMQTKSTPIDDKIIKAAAHMSKWFIDWKDYFPYRVLYVIAFPSSIIVGFELCFPKSNLRIDRSLQCWQRNYLKIIEDILFSFSLSTVILGLYKLYKSSKWIRPSHLFVYSSILIHFIKRLKYIHNCIRTPFVALTELFDLTFK